MKIAKTKKFRPTLVLLCFGLICLPYLSPGACNCPNEEECAPCEGGLTNLSLLYEGGSDAFIVILDSRETYYRGTTEPGATIDLQGTRGDGRFERDRIYVFVNSIYSFYIDVDCSTDIFVNTTFNDDFTVVAGISKHGGPLCCAEGEADDTPPEISNCPANITTELTDESCSISVDWEVPSATDDCEVNFFGSTHDPEDEFEIGTTTVTYTATDQNGNSSSCSFDVTVSDASPPVINNCPEDLEISASASACSAVANWTPPEATDNCSINSFQSNYSPGSSFDIGTTEVTYTASDNAGNTTSCSFNVTVRDDKAPVFSNCPEDIVMNANDGGCTAKVEWTPPDITDNCNLASTSSSHSPGDEFQPGTTEVTYTATDDVGNSSTCTFNVLIEDNNAPVFSNCPEDITLDYDGSNCFKTVNWDDPDVTDNCNIANLSNSHSPGDEFPIGTTTVTYTATDDAGNESTCSFNITIEDNNKPVFTNCPEDIVVDLGGDGCTASVSWDEPNATDDCNIESITSSHSPGHEFQVGTTEVIYTAIDEAGNSESCSFNVLVEDNDNPIFSNCPEDIDVDLAGSDCSAVVDWIEPDISGNCNFSNLTSTHEPGDEFPKGITEVIYTATDDDGNTATCSFEVRVGDVSDSFFSDCPEDIEIELTDSFCPQIVEWNAPEINDQCATYTIESSHESGDEFSLGTTEVVYTATDSDGNSNTCTFNVVIRSNYTSRLDQCPDNITIVSETTDSISVDWQAPEIIIECHSYTLNSNFNPGDKFGFGTTEVTYSVLGSEGIEERCTFNVSIIDEENFPPEAEDVDILARPGEEIEICINASDAENDPLVVDEILSDDLEGTIFDQFDDDLCFVYEVPDDFTGKETFEVSICEDTELGQCTSVQVNLEIVEDTDIQVSQVVTPDGDGFNDLWIIENIESYSKNRVSIFDRWGGLIFEAEGYDNETIVWDGYNNGKKAPVGTYFYTIEIEEKALVERGFIELIK